MWHDQLQVFLAGMIAGIIVSLAVYAVFGDKTLR